MVQFCTGIPGAGKSYYGIFNISIHFSKLLKDDSKFKKFALDQTKYTACLTNLNEIKLDKFHNVHSFVFNDFYQVLKRLHGYYKLGYTDTQLIEECKEDIFFNVLIVLDECQNYLNKDDEVLVWWLSYHRHFNQDIILITHEIPLVHKKYKSFTEFFYKSLPSSKKIFNTSMVYQQFTGYQMFNTQKGSTKKLPIIKELFTYYVSGANQKQKSLVLHFLFISLAFLSLVLLGGYLFISSKTSTVEKPIQNMKQVPVIKTNKVLKNNNLDGDYFQMFCNSSLCFINNNIYEKSFILHILNNKYETQIISTLGNKYFFITKDKFNLFQLKIRSTENEKTGVNNPFDIDLFKSESK